MAVAEVYETVVAEHVTEPPDRPARRSLTLNSIGFVAACITLATLLQGRVSTELLVLHLTVALVLWAGVVASCLGRFRAGVPCDRLSVVLVAVAVAWLGSLVWLDPSLAHDNSALLSTLIVMYALAALLAVTFGLSAELARSALISALLPGALAALRVGNVVIALATFAFLVVIAGFGVSLAGNHYRELQVLRRRSAEAAEASARMARRDPLTNLLNRHGITEVFSARRRDRQAALFVDLDRFKEVNDRAGHLAGDELLILVGRRLVEVVDPDTAVGRLGGDEFLVITPDIEAAGLDDLAERILSALGQPFALAGSTHTISASVGMTIVEPDTSLEQVLGEADRAMLRAKKSGRGASMLFTEEVDREWERRMAIERQLRQRLETADLGVEGMPVVELLSGRVAAVELLARPRFDESLAVEAGEWLQMLDDLDLVDDLAEIMLRFAADARLWWRESDDLADTAVTVNVAASSLQSDRLHRQLVDLVEEFELGPGELIIEVSGPVGGTGFGMEPTRRTLDRIRSLGVEVALDSFGSGSSSLGSLVQLPASVVKMDGHLIGDVLELDESRATMAAIVDLARSRGQRTVIAGIENDTQLDLAFTSGADLGQGSRLGRSCPLRDIPVVAAWAGWGSDSRV